ncbi:MAG: peptidase C14 caspase catalytic subunit p20 [Alphaproteobacteria bacterium]|nr:MAG: peptidase C14 caspase catalytic subunit p20 [Alphaproteobacteria bacterium]
MWKNALLSAALVVFMVGLAPGNGYADDEKVKRFALVIGNQNYIVSPLKNSANDARSISKALLKIGFDVTTAYDLSSQGFAQSITAFYDHIKTEGNRKSLAFFYYAGHAVQVNHRNYLVPVEMDFTQDENWADKLFDINQLFASFPKHIAMQNVVVLDACRNNPFKGMDDGLYADGLAPLRAPANTLIAYATEPGSVASDGKGKNGVYTKYFLKSLKNKVTIEEMFKKVRKGVSKETRKKQIPWEHSSLLEDVFLNPPKNRKMPALVTF